MDATRSHWGGQQPNWFTAEIAEESALRRAATRERSWVQGRGAQEREEELKAAQRGLKRRINAAKIALRTAKR